MSTKKFTNMDFEIVIGRLKQALAVNKDNDIAVILGFSKTTFSARKKRGALPCDKIKLICREKSINENWVFYGEGEMFLQDEPLPHVNDSTPKHNPPPRNDRIPALTEKQLEMARLISALPDEEQDKAIADLKKKIIEYLSGDTKKG